MSRRRPEAEVLVLVAIAVLAATLWVIAVVTLYQSDADDPPADELTSLRVHLDLPVDDDALVSLADSACETWDAGGWDERRVADALLDEHEHPTDAMTDARVLDAVRASSWCDQEDDR